MKSQPDAWYAKATRADWKSSAELKKQYKTASIVSAERVVFNVKGNDYRLVIVVNYAHQVVLIKWLGTHQEYDNIDLTKVMYDESCYADSTDKNRARS